MRILIVEDDVISSMFIKEELDRYGDCHTVGNGAAALRAYVDAALSRKPFDVIIMDITMPVMNGLTAIDRIREYEAQNRRHVRRPAQVVVATGMEDVREILNDFKVKGVIAYMRKPLRQKVIKSVMAKIAKVFKTEP